MIEINLFPWREYRRSSLRQRFYISALGVVIGTCMIIVALMCSNIKKNQNQWAVNSFFQQRISKLKNALNMQQKDTELRENLLRRLEIFRKVNNNQAVVTHFINGMTQVLPNSSYYTSISFSHDRFLLEGRAQSSIQLSSLLEKIKAENWLLQTDNSKITEKVGQDIFSIWFRLQIMIT